MDPDELFEILADGERRQVLKQLIESDERCHVGLLKNRCEVDEYRLHHFHLPKMDRVGLLTYDAQEGDVSLTEKGSKVEYFLKILEDIKTTNDLPTSPTF